MFGCFSNVIFRPPPPPPPPLLLLPPPPPQLGSKSIMELVDVLWLPGDCNTLTDVLQPCRSLDTAAMWARVEPLLVLVCVMGLPPVEVVDGCCGLVWCCGCCC